jgi:outer membrane immunogenic protein
VLKTFALSTVSALALAGTALAADLPRRAAPPLLPPPLPIFTWTGAYFGINAGYISSDRSTVNVAGLNAVAAANVATGARPAQVRLETDGFTGGGQVGYNYQIGNFVLGVEADAAYTDMDRTVAVVGTTGALTAHRSTLDYLGTVRGRLGIAFDRVLVYGTGGFAYGDVTNTGLYFAPAGSGVLQFSGRSSQTETGWAAGGGIEYALPTDSFLNFFRSSAVTLKAEGLYYDLGRRNVAILNTGAGPAANPGYVARFEQSGFIARVGLNYKFGTF